MRDGFGKGLLVRVAVLAGRVMDLPQGHECSSHFVVPDRRFR
jgi:hypothetical protein